MLNKFLDKYIFTSTLKYTNHNFYLLNIPFVIAPVDILINLLSSQDINEHKKIYSSFKNSTIQNFIPRFSDLKIPEKKEIDFVKTFFVAFGWGAIEIIDFDEATKRAIIIVENSPFAKELAGKTKFPIDTILRGVFAGLFSAMLKEDLDCVETECVALNSKACKFVVKQKNEFDLEKQIVRDQLIFDE